MQASPIVLDEDVVLAPLLAEIATRMADEGVPIRAIARTLQVHPTPVREALSNSIFEGRIVEMPCDDWPPGTKRTEHIPVNRRRLSDQEAHSLLRQTFSLTKTEASLFLPLLTKPGAHTKEALHHMAYNNGADGGPEIKIVDVMICKIRKKLAPHGLNEHLKTVWGDGYRLTPEGHVTIEQMLIATLEGKPLPELKAAA